MEEESREIDWKIWGKTGKERPQRIVQLEGLWENVPFDVSAEDIRQYGESCLQHCNAVPRSFDRHAHRRYYLVTTGD